MFTGIIESLGTVKNIVRASHSFSIEIQSDFNEKLVLGESISATVALNPFSLGESIAVNGVCLTVAEFSGSVFKADVTPETFSRTSLKILRPGSFVNLERAMKADGRFGGHIVSGHIDGTGRILAFLSGGP